MLDLDIDFDTSKILSFAGVCSLEEAEKGRSYYPGAPLLIDGELVWAGLVSLSMRHAWQDEHDTPHSFTAIVYHRPSDRVTWARSLDGCPYETASLEAAKLAIACYAQAAVDNRVNPELS